MAAEALLWSAIAVLATTLRWVSAAERRLRLGRWTEWLEAFAPWIHGLGPTFLAAFTGALAPASIGLIVPNVLTGWILPCVGLIVLLAGCSAWLKQNPLKRPPLRFDHVVLDEPRWALYRATGGLLLAHDGLGLILGLGLGLLEWTLRHRTWRPESRGETRVCLDLARVATSTIAFALSRNLWLTIAFQLGLVSMLAESESGE